MKHRSFYFLLILVLLIVDQITKAIVFQKIAFLSSQSIIPGFFNLTHIHNRGAIFGFFSQSDSQLLHIVLMLATLVALALVVYYFFMTPPAEKLTKISLSLILAGALGNLIDRVFRGYVIDFLDLYIKKWHWPSFNVADSCVTIGAFLLVFIVFFKRRRICTPSS
ncbi:MAG: signal peptidase II [Candidatus Aminicenantes bacterium]|nr:signal peptidase II [Candidatus Aminicenantes bacterium]